jgi:hypothetical protein
MPEIVPIPLADLLVDTRNARLKVEQPSQPAAILALAKGQGRRLIQLAADIVDHGLDPLSLTAVVPTSDQKKRYMVIEGNRRVVALKALETPSLAAAALDGKQQTRLNKLSLRFAKNPITSVTCVLFESQKDLEDLNRWVTLRHTGQNEGVGLVEWGSDEKDRFAARHGQRSPAGQIIDFVEQISGQELTAKQSGRGGIITSLTRLISNPQVRERLGIEQAKGEISSWYPAQEVKKGLARIVEDLSTERVKVGDIYSVQQRIQYAQNLKRTDLPNPRTRLPSPVQLSSVMSSGTTSGQQLAKAKRVKKRPPPSERTTLIPKNCQLNINPPRINAIYIEALGLTVNQYANASAILLRVFVELSVDHYVTQNSLATEEARRNWPLARRLKLAANDLVKKGKIDTQLKDAIEKIADSQGVLAASTVTFNMYVHNKYVFPKPSELILAWDELQPFMEQLWP